MDSTLAQLVAGMEAYWLLILACPAWAIDIKLKVHPEPDDPKSSLIWFNRSTYNVWSQKLDNFIEVYRTPSLTEGRQENMVKCSYEKQHDPESVCQVDVEVFNPCVVTNYFGYRTFKPCIFLELHKVIEWRPEFYNLTTPLPSNMPNSLKNHIDQFTLENPSLRNTVWVSCEGDTPADKEFIGPVKYIPYQGFPTYLFPYVGQKGYLNPILAVSFSSPQNGVVINVVCKAWAPGIRQDDKKDFGLAKFQFLLETV